jgi:3-dehydroquinate synthase
MTRVRLHLKERSYDIAIGANLIGKSGVLLRRLGMGRDAVVVTNGRLRRLFGELLKEALEKRRISVRYELVPDSEKAKSSAIAARVIDSISAYDTFREIFIIAFGGGVVGDLAGFVASIYKRGVPYVQMPTTLLAQVDSAIGGKVAVDLAVAKNLVGAFYQPKAVLSDTALLKPLPVRHLRNGLAEVIKYGVIKDRHLFEYLEKNCDKVLERRDEALEFIVSRSTRIKAAVVEKDEFDKKGVRAILNFGHTIGHAVEAASGYSERFLHGEAVAIGMAAASRIAAAMGLIKSSDASRIEALIGSVGLPVSAKGLKPSRVYDAHLHDKKFIHRVNRFVLPTGIGSVRVVEDVSTSLVKDTLKGLCR